MPRLRRRGHIIRDSLTDQQEWNLLIGDFPNAFHSEQARREAWVRHRHEFSMNDLTRPAAWWDYDSPEPRNRQEKSHIQLDRLGMLTESERRLLESERRHAAAQ